MSGDGEMGRTVSGLIQVDDPLEKKAPVAKPIGIDLGTTFSLVAHVSCGRPQIIVDGAGHALVPSVVHFAEGGQVVVGDEAALRAIDYPEDTIASAKRFMGKGAGDAETRRLGSYRFVAGDGPVVRFCVEGVGGASREVTPVEVSAEVLRALRLRAEKALGGAVGGAVITVPAYFDEAQRQATKDAGRLAGLTVLRLLNEPTAAALAYGLDKKRDGVFAVYDLGGGTFDISILKLIDGVFQVQATGGDTALGGDDFDRAVALRVLEAVDERPAGLIRAALVAAREAKHRLTEAEEAVIDFEHKGQRFKNRLTRDEFDALIRPWVERTAATCRRAMRDAGCAPADLDGVILVGGSTRVPLVRRFVRELFGVEEPLADIDPDQVVALGAAVQADLLAGTGPRDDVLLLDVTPLSLGLEMMGGVVERIVPRNSPIPTSAAQVFTTYADGQTGMDIHVLQGERDLVADCRSLARFTLSGIPPMPAGIGRVKVTFLVDADGLLQVTAEEETTHVVQSVSVKPTYGLTDEEVERMLIESYERAEGDVRERALRVERVEAERMLAAAESAMAADRDILAGDVEAAIGAALQALCAAVAGTDADAIRRAAEALDRAAAPFAEARMNRAIQGAIRGKSVDAVLEKRGA
jgi:molecular chaperone HscA